ncbi:hypothetical protein CEXT_638311 [Caerostris extrusa]|uniref:Uncharacterized protein n=1 Tax=Caerostris extrusa TaxID=172846 RepID=A0AAV4SU12_CAEEX|nr:hypothetical protein CEXT_638311 [Caerostris extrusa]
MRYLTLLRERERKESFIEVEHEIAARYVCIWKKNRFVNLMKNYKKASATMDPTFISSHFASYYEMNPPPPSEVRCGDKVSRDPISRFHLSGDRYRYMDDLYSSPTPQG